MSGLLHRRPTILFVCGALVAGGCAALVLALFSGGDASASKASFTVDAPARESMGALQDGATPTASPEVVNGIPDGLAPVDEVHVLLSEVGAQGLTIAAWPSGEHGVCYKSSAGGAGCFDRFHEPFNWTISDPDSLGAGSPISVWGFVSDEVAAVSVLLDGEEVPALVENNAVFVELPDAATRPEGIGGFRLTSVDGAERVYLHGATRAQLQSAAGKSIPAVESMSVFSEPPSSTKSTAPVPALSAALPARASMSALTNADALHSIPAAAQGLPGDVAPTAGTVRALISNAGASNVSIYAWPLGDGNRVCVSTSFGSGGCFNEFQKGEYFNVTESDPDRLGGGRPLVVWGVVPDEVIGVTVVVLGEHYPALVRNNAVLFEMPDSSLAHAAIGSFVVQLADGTTQEILN